MLPELFITRMQTLLGAEFDAFLAAYDRPRNVGLRLNPAKRGGEGALAAFALTQVPWAENGFYYDPGTRPGLCVCHEAGRYYLQEPSAMAPAGLLDAQPGEKILDLCAAPGGKSTQLAAAMGGKGLLVCNEINPKRARILAQNIERMGISNALVLNEHPQRLEGFFPGYFDKILVDAPCSGEGMFRKEAAAVTDWSVETVEMCARRQQEILQTASKLLRPGGRLVYSTCTFSPQENEGVISRFLWEHPDFSVETVDAPWFSPGRPDWIEQSAPGLEHTFRLWPHLLRGEGHFAAVLRQQGGGEAAEPLLERGCAQPKELDAFLQATGAALPDGHLMAFGQRLYWVPTELPALKGLKVLRAGLELGEVLKNRFEPAHAWALWLQDFGSTANFPLDAPEIEKFMRGESIPGSQTGWTRVAADGLSLGWAKGSGGQLKNHVPKALRHG